MSIFSLYCSSRLSSRAAGQALSTGDAPDGISGGIRCYPAVMRNLSEGALTHPVQHVTGVSILKNASNLRAVAPLALPEVERQEVFCDTRPDHSRDTRPDFSRDTRPDNSCDTRPDDSRDTRSDHSRDTRPDDSRDTGPDDSRDTRSNNSRDARPDNSRDTRPYDSRDTGPYHSRDTGPDDSRDTRSNNSRDANTRPDIRPDHSHDMHLSSNNNEQQAHHDSTTTWPRKRGSGVELSREERIRTSSTTTTYTPPPLIPLTVCSLSHLVPSKFGSKRESIASAADSQYQFTGPPVDVAAASCEYAEGRRMVDEGGGESGNKTQGQRQRSSTPRRITTIQANKLLPTPEHSGEEAEYFVPHNNSSSETYMEHRPTSRADIDISGSNQALYNGHRDVAQITERPYKAEDSKSVHNVNSMSDLKTYDRRREVVTSYSNLETMHRKNVVFQPQHTGVFLPRGDQAELIKKQTYNANTNRFTGNLVFQACPSVSSSQDGSIKSDDSFCVKYRPTVPNDFYKRQDLSSPLSFVESDVDHSKVGLNSLGRYPCRSTPNVSANLTTSSRNNSGQYEALPNGQIDGRGSSRTVLGVSINATDPVRDQARRNSRDSTKSTTEHLRNIEAPVYSLGMIDNNNEKCNDRFTTINIGCSYPISELRGQSGELRGQSGELQGKSGELRGQSGELRGQSGELRGQSGELRGQSRELRSQSGELRGQSGAHGMRTDLRKCSNAVDALFKINNELQLNRDIVVSAEECHCVTVADVQLSRNEPWSNQTVSNNIARQKKDVIINTEPIRRANITSKNYYDDVRLNGDVVVNTEIQSNYEGTYHDVAKRNTDVRVETNSYRPFIVDNNRNRNNSIEDGRKGGAIDALFKHQELSMPLASYSSRGSTLLARESYSSSSNSLFTPGRQPPVLYDPLGSAARPSSSCSIRSTHLLVAAPKRQQSMSLNPPPPPVRPLMAFQPVDKIEGSHNYHHSDLNTTASGTFMKNR